MHAPGYTDLLSGLGMGGVAVGGVLLVRVISRGHVGTAALAWTVAVAAILLAANELDGGDRS